MKAIKEIKGLDFAKTLTNLAMHPYCDEKQLYTIGIYLAIEEDRWGDLLQKLPEEVKKELRGEERIKMLFILHNLSGYPEELFEYLIRKEEERRLR